MSYFRAKPPIWPHPSICLLEVLNKVCLEQGWVSWDEADVNTAGIARAQSQGSNYPWVQFQPDSFWGARRWHRDVTLQFTTTPQRHCRLRPCQGHGVPICSEKTEAQENWEDREHGVTFPFLSSLILTPPASSLQRWCHSGCCGQRRPSWRTPSSPSPHPRAMEALGVDCVLVNGATRMYFLHYTCFLSPDRRGIKDLSVLCGCLLLPWDDSAEPTDRDGRFCCANPSVSLTGRMRHIPAKELWTRHPIPSQCSLLPSKRNYFKAVILDSLLVISVSDTCFFHVRLCLAFSHIATSFPSLRQIPELPSPPPSPRNLCSHLQHAAAAASFLFKLLDPLFLEGISNHLLPRPPGKPPED